MASVSVYRSCSLPHSRFLDVTQRFPQNTAADELANHSSGSIFRNLFAPDSPFETCPITYRFFIAILMWKSITSNTRQMAALEEAFRKASSKFKISELNAYQKLAIRKVFVEKEDVFMEGVDRPNTTHKLVITV